MNRKVVIGLEVHCELKTNSKVFSTSSNDYEALTNTNISALDLAFPGTMPSVNIEAVKLAIKVAYSLNCKIPDELLFDRKNYFYPDLPKGFQITQMTKPLGKNGSVEIIVDGKSKNILITQLHLEEDTASFNHMSDISLINYNRAGIPLIEIVTEPCLESATEATIYLENLRNIIRYCKASVASLEKGEFRCDVNISLMEQGSNVFGTKVEVKNINSFSNVKNAINYEIKRQNDILDKGQKVIMETRRFDDKSNTTVSMREKTEAVDYKYFIEPNIPPIKLDALFLEDIKKSIPLLPTERYKKYRLLGLSETEALILTKDISISDYFDKCASKVNPKTLFNVITNQLMAHLNANNTKIEDISFKSDDLAELLEIYEAGTISSKQMAELLDICLKENLKPKEVIKRNRFSQVTDEDNIRKVVLEVLGENEKAVSDYSPEKTNMIGFFVGLVMKKSLGKSNPQITANIVKEELDNIVK